MAVIENIGEKIKKVIGDLLGRSNTVSKKVITAFDSSKEPEQNRLLLLKFSRAELETCAEFLGIPLTHPTTGVKLFSNRDKLVKRIVLSITALFPTICSECNVEYQVPFDSTPLLRCHVCLQGSHDCKQFSDILGITQTIPALQGNVWLCSFCYIANDVSAKASSKSTQQTPTPSSSATHHQLSSELLISKLQAVADDQNKSQAGTSVTAEPICPKFIIGECPHGRSGKTAYNGIDSCPHPHPKRCNRFIRHGADQSKGCTAGDECEFYHPQHCKSSLESRTCFNEGCKLLHLVGTKRKPKSPKVKKKDPPKKHAAKNGKNDRRSQNSSSRNNSRSNNNTNNSGSINHFLELQSLLKSMQGSFQKELNSLKSDLAAQKTSLTQLQQSQTHPPAPPSSAPPVPPPPSSGLYNQVFPPLPAHLMTPQTFRQFPNQPALPNWTNWNHTPQVSF